VVAPRIVRRVRTLVWEGLDTWRAECARVTLRDDRLSAQGVQIGVDPEPYRLDYELVCGEGFVTQELRIRCGERELHLVREGDKLGAIDALDCDLGFSPLTNTMPVLRHRLHERAGAEDFLMAWVAVPELTVHASAQRYEHVRPGVVRYVDRGTHDGFTAELELDGDGFAVVYPALARRVGGSAQEQSS
jgi:hypothetical protein